MGKNRHSDKPRNGWLTLTVGQGGVVRIGDVILHVDDIRGRTEGRSSQVRLSFHADRSIQIHRGELAYANRDGLITRVMGGLQGHDQQG